MEKILYKNRSDAEKIRKISERIFYDTENKAYYIVKSPQCKKFWEF
jgi:L-fucose mutarotase/ribose pyranase (RbsD/FucU family)